MARRFEMTLCFLLLLEASAVFGQERTSRAGKNPAPDAPAEQRQSFRQAALQDNGYILTAAAEARYNESLSGTDFLTEELRSALSHKSFVYQGSTSSSLIGRATEAAARTFISRTPSGKEKLNTSYFLSVLGSAVIHTAYRPYWNRPVSAPFSDFGSTIGNDAGMRVLHEFQPALEQLVKSHTPRFVSKFEAGVMRK